MGCVFLRWRLAGPVDWDRSVRIDQKRFGDQGGKMKRKVGLWAGSSFRRSQRGWLRNEGSLFSGEGN